MITRSLSSPTRNQTTSPSPNPTSPLFCNQLVQSRYDLEGELAEPSWYKGKSPTTHKKSATVIPRSHSTNRGNVSGVTEFAGESQGKSTIRLRDQVRAEVGTAFHAAVLVDCSYNGQINLLQYSISLP